MLYPVYSIHFRHTYNISRNEKKCMLYIIVSNMKIWRCLHLMSSFILIAALSSDGQFPISGGNLGRINYFSNIKKNGF